MKALWLKADEIAACTVNVPTNNVQILEKESEIETTWISCINKNRRSFWTSYKTTL